MMVFEEQHVDHEKMMSPFLLELNKKRHVVENFEKAGRSGYDLPFMELFPFPFPFPLALPLPLTSSLSLNLVVSLSLIP